MLSLFKLSLSLSTFLFRTASSSTSLSIIFCGFLTDSQCIDGISSCRVIRKYETTSLSNLFRHMPCNFTLTTWTWFTVLADSVPSSIFLLFSLSLFLLLSFLSFSHSLSHLSLSLSLTLSPFSLSLCGRITFPKIVFTFRLSTRSRFPPDTYIDEDFARAFVFFGNFDRLFMNLLGTFYMNWLQSAKLMIKW